MSIHSLAPAINFPLSPRANHGLWTSAFHLLHPEVEANQFSDKLIWPKPDKVLDFNETKKKEFYNPVSGQADLESDIFFRDYQGAKTEDAQKNLNALIEYSNVGVRFIPRCLNPLEGWSLCVDDTCTRHENGDGPRYKSSGCPGVNAPEEAIISSINMVSSFACSTMSAATVNYNQEAVNNLARQRSKYLEAILVGTSDMPPWGNRLSANATLLGSGPQKPDFALAMLEEKLAECLGDEIGMIHAPVSVANLWMNDYVRKESESYEDGMGSRSVLRTDVRGNVIVAGSGYGTALGPGDVLPGPNQAYVYATSFVYLNWAETTVHTKVIREMTDTKINLTTARAEQEMYPIYNPCCVFAVLVDLC